MAVFLSLARSLTDPARDLFGCPRDIAKYFFISDEQEGSGTTTAPVTTRAPAMASPRGSRNPAGFRNDATTAVLIVLGAAFCAWGVSANPPASASINHLGGGGDGLPFPVPPAWHRDQGIYGCIPGADANSTTEPSGVSKNGKLTTFLAREKVFEVFRNACETTAGRRRRQCRTPVIRDGNDADARPNQFRGPPEVRRPSMHFVFTFARVRLADPVLGPTATS